MINLTLDTFLGYFFIFFIILLTTSYIFRFLSDLKRLLK